MAETVLTTRRARYRLAEGRWTPGRLRVTDRRLLLLAPDGTTSAEVALGALLAVRVARRPRASIVVDTADGSLGVRCFEVAAVADLLAAAALRAGRR